jgi:hypothetical protein
MALYSPSRVSSALRSVAPGRPTMAVRSQRPSSRRSSRPYDAPSPRNLLPDKGCSSGATVRLSPLAGSGRLVTTHIVAMPPCLDAGFHTRSVPPTPFLTTLTACSSSDPVKCFVHSRPWGSVPAPCCRLRSVGPKTSLPGACPAELHRSSFRSDPGGELSCRRLPVDSAPNSCRSIHPDCVATAPSGPSMPPK